MELKLTLRLLTNEERIFGPGVAELLERVQEHHSLRSAAASMEMAYSKAILQHRRPPRRRRVPDAGGGAAADRLPDAGDGGQCLQSGTFSRAV